MKILVFVETWGTFTDISYLCPAWGVAGVNLSVGYEDEHSAIETLHVNAWQATFEKVKNILSEEEFLISRVYSNGLFSNLWWHFKPLGGINTHMPAMMNSHWHTDIQ